MVPYITGCGIGTHSAECAGAYTDVYVVERIQWSVMELMRTCMWWNVFSGMLWSLCGRVCDGTYSVECYGAYADVYVVELIQWSVVELI